MTELEGSLSADASIEGSIDNLYVVEIGDYLNVSNKPSIDGHTLMPGSTSKEIGLAKLTDLPGISVQGLIAGLNFPDGETVFQDDRGELSVPLDRYDTRAEVDAKLSSQAGKLTTDIATAKSQAISQANRYTDDTVANARTDLQSYADGAAGGAVDRARSYTDAEVVKAKASASDYTDAQVAQAKSQMLSELDSRLVSTFKPQGSSAFADLPQPSAATLGYVYNVTDDFVTTDAFKEGAGKHLPAGTNVYVYQDGSSFGWDSFAGEVDLSALSDAIEAKQDRIALPGNASYYFDGTGTFSVPPDTTYGPVSTAQSGLAPKLSGISTQYLNGLGQWTTPPGAGADAVTELEERVDRINDFTTGINLFRSTRDFSKGTTFFYSGETTLRLDGFSSNAAFDYYVDEDGFTVAHVSASGLTSDSLKALYASVIRKPMKAGEYVTFGFEFMVDDLVAFDVENLARYATIDAKTAVFGNVFSITLADLDLSKATMESGKWYQAQYQWLLPRDIGTDYFIRFALVLSRNGSIRYRKLWAYQGKINHGIYSESALDSATVGQLAPIEKGVPRYLGTRTSIEANTDLNDLKVPGSYACYVDTTVPSLTHCPVTRAFILDVEYTTGNTPNYLRQVLTDYRTSDEWVREKIASTGDYGEWRQTYRYNTVRPLEGGGTARTDGLARGVVGRPLANGDDLNTKTETGTYFANSAAIASSLVHAPSGLNAACSMVVTPLSTSTGGMAVCQMMFTYVNSRIYVRRCDNNLSFNDWALIYTENDMVDVPHGGTGAQTVAQAQENLSMYKPSSIGGVKDLDDLPNGFHNWNNSTAHTPVASSYGTLIQFDNGQASASQRWLFQVGITTNNPGVIYHRSSINGSSWQAWKSLYSSISATASHTANGLMSSADKIKLDGIDATGVRTFDVKSKITTSEYATVTSATLAVNGRVAQLHAIFSTKTALTTGTNTYSIATLSSDIAPIGMAPAATRIGMGPAYCHSGHITSDTRYVNIEYSDMVASGTTIAVASTYILASDSILK